MEIGHEIRERGVFVNRNSANRWRGFSSTAMEKKGKIKMEEEYIVTLGERRLMNG